MDFEKACNRLSLTYLDVVLCAVGLGDPLAPSLFVLAIEGADYQIRLKVKGVVSPGLQTIRELQFADDACCALHNLVGRWTSAA
ncbi:BQ5605_C023g09600 [Microbotryum silenes-dioicae]|uniref:BQ5605_C023g09600 protein n=1 Tax=Microbotryum silenes-dioicae TaxID=796604 RepID=A0A2X0MPA7_9BASI|nr:BQ5605_C023g09600 [Microbotryum silenes-dioicae]